MRRIADSRRLLARYSARAAYMDEAARRLSMAGRERVAALYSESARTYREAAAIVRSEERPLPAAA
jgi:hypothetical protein